MFFVIDSGDSDTVLIGIFISGYRLATGSLPDPGFTERGPARTTGLLAGFG